VPVAPELKHLIFGSVIRVVAKIRLARMALAKLQQAIFGTRAGYARIQEDAYISRNLSLLLCGSEVGL
jgi:hypothetical protein